MESRDSRITARCWAIRLSEGLSKPQLRQRGKRIFTAYIRNDTQLEHCDRPERDVMVFHLARSRLGG